MGFFSLEMSKEQLVMRRLCAESRLNAYNLQHGFVTPQDWCQLNAAGEKLAKAPIYIDDASDNTGLEAQGQGPSFEDGAGFGEEVFKDKKRKAKETAPVKEGVADIIVAKQRNGPTGTVQLALVKAYTRFENLAY